MKISIKMTKCIEDKQGGRKLLVYLRKIGRTGEGILLSGEYVFNLCQMPQRN